MAPGARPPLKQGAARYSLVENAVKSWTGGVTPVTLRVTLGRGGDDDEDYRAMDPDTVAATADREGGQRLRGRALQDGSVGGENRTVAAAPGVPGFRFPLHGQAPWVHVLQRATQQSASMQAITT